MSQASITAPALQQVIRTGVPLMGAWGVEVLRAEAGTALLRLPYSAQLLRPGGVISGPALMGLADAALWACLLSLSEGQDESVTSNLNINFLRRVPPRAVLADARLIKRGRTLSYGEVNLIAEADDAVLAHVTCTYATMAR